MSGRWELTQDFMDALLWATQLHGNQWRKGSAQPVSYLTHLYSTTGLVMEDGGSTAETIATLFHDTPEDQGGQKMLDQIRARFGDEVADLVEGCTDSLSEDPTQKRPWRERKEEHLDKLKIASSGVKRITLADKLHNLRSTSVQYRETGPSFWEKFKGGRDGTFWYYSQVIQLMKDCQVHSFLLEELQAEYDRFRAQVEAQEGLLPA